MSETAQRLRDRLRQRSSPLPSGPQSLPTEVPNGLPPQQHTHGLQPTSPKQELSTDRLNTALAAPDLRTRFVRYFQYIAENMPLGGMSPMVQALSKRLFPLFAKELEKFSDEDIERTGMVALATLAKLYAPDADSVILDFRTMTLHAANAPSIVDDDTEKLLAEADAALQQNDLLAPPPPDFSQPVVDEEPLVGIEVDGRIVHMRQSEYQKLMEGAE